MKCAHCNQNEAICFLSRVLNGKLYNLALCGSCAEKEGLKSLPFITLDQLLHTYPDISETDTTVIGTEELRCECGISFRTFRMTGKLGCPKCYETFSEQLEPIISSVQKGLEHKGKVPRACRTEGILRKQIDELRARLNRALANDNPSEAALCRDQIRAYEYQLKELK